MLRTTKAKSLIPKTAEELGLTQELVHDVINHYYTELRKMMESLEYPSIGIPILGTFNASHNKLIKSVETLTFILEDDNEVSFQKIAKYNLTAEMRDKQKELVDKIQKEKDGRKQRYKDLGKQKKDS